MNELEAFKQKVIKTAVKYAYDDPELMEWFMEDLNLLKPYTETYNKLWGDKR